MSQSVLPEKASLKQHSPQLQLIVVEGKNVPPLKARRATAQRKRPPSALSRKGAVQPPLGQTTVRREKWEHSQRAQSKQPNPNSKTPFNHRARFTKLKRGIHAQRRWVLDHLSAAPLPIRAGAVVRPVHLKASAALPSPTSSQEEWASDGEGNGGLDAVVGRSGPCCDSLAAVERAVEVMDSLYTRLNAAMKGRRYRQAAKLKRCIRARQQRLRRELQARALHGSVGSDAGGASHETCDTAGVGVQQTHAIRLSGDVELQSPYRSFHPPSTWLGVGRHPHSTWVDQRTGRYPQQCTEGHLQAVVHHFINGGVADPETLPDVCKAMIPAPPSAPPSTVRSRSQRAMRSSLFAAAYCANILTDALDDLCFTLLQGLCKEQRDLKQKQPLQFKARQRYVVGFQEVIKCLKAGRVRLVLLATDVEAVEAPVSEPPRPPPYPPSLTTPGVHRTASPSARPASKPSRKKAFQTLQDAVHLVQELCGLAGPAKRETVAHLSVNRARAPPLCVSCMSRQRLSYALHAKGSKVSCVAVLHAEKSREALKAVMCYAHYLSHVYTVEHTAKNECRGA
ncbi:hypothetical protein LSCM1_01360 [Leishmania martiniquensis]|uniref:Ribosomal protein L7Ae/L30e/S12e/Gadd45 domain-containing protein n=1 Tax=Leishmania martiniquensis TaxID=1580590 RepID=A0A836GAH6_9TRYP|nr:hypothetical protein LSCM1_01360 [Leishmania martiniquensis]